MHTKQNEIESRAIEIARYIIDNHATVRMAAKHFCVSKSTVHKDVKERLQNYSFTLFEQVETVLSENKAERHMRGGLATREKYLRLQNS